MGWTALTPFLAVSVRKILRTLSVVVPTYNEAANVERLVSEVSRVLAGIDYEIIIADDDSPDLTWKKAEELSRCNPGVRALRRQGQRGLAPAVAEGFAMAEGEFVACMDADLQHDPAILPGMLAELRGRRSLVVGSRYVDGGGISNWNPLRRFASTAATLASHVATGLRIKDPMSGYFMMRRADFMRVCPQLNLRGFKILLEIAARLRHARVAELPYTFRPRQQGESKLRALVVLDYFKQLASLYCTLQPERARFLKYAIVGGSGVIVNLLVFLALVHSLGWRDWRGSAVATLVATVNNFGWNNAWTFRDRTHSGWRVLRGYLCFAANPITTFSGSQR